MRFLFIFLVAFALGQEVDILTKPPELFAAAEAGDLAKIKTLLKKKHDVDGRNRLGESALHLAAKTGNLEMAKILVGAGADIEARDRFGWRPLLLAANEGHLELVQFLHQKGADLNAGEMAGITALMWAATAQQHEIIKYLAENGADINKRDNTGRTALDFVRHSTYKETTKFLKDLGFGEGEVVINPNLPQPEFPTAGPTPEMPSLVIQAMKGDLDKLNKLLAEGEDPNQTDGLGRTALHLAAMGEKTHIVDRLLEAGAKADVVDNAGRQPIIFAAGSGNLDLLKTLQKNGADLDNTDNKGTNLLMWAASGDHIKVIKYLIREGADPNLADKEGRTAFDVVKGSHDHKEATKLLRLLGAKPGNHPYDKGKFANQLQLELKAQPGGKLEMGQGGSGGFTISDQGRMLSPLVGDLILKATEHLRADENEKALGLLQQAVEIDPACITCWDTMLATHLRREELNLAIVCLEKLQTLGYEAEKLARRYYDVGVYLAYRNQHTKNEIQTAEIYLRSALKLSEGKLNEAHFQLGLLFDRYKFTKEARKMLTLYLEGETKLENAVVARSKLGVWNAAVSGTKAPIAMKGLDGSETLDLSKWKGKVILLDFWATWCKPCVMAEPSLRQFHKMTKKGYFELISISVDKDMADVRNHLKTHDMPWHHYHDPIGRIAQGAWGVESYPTFVIIDHEGNFAYALKGWSSNHPRELQSKLSKYIRKAKKAAKKAGK